MNAKTIRKVAAALEKSRHGYRCKAKLTFLSWLSLAYVAFGVTEPSVLSSAIRWYDFSDTAHYTVDGSGNVLTVNDRSGKSNPAGPKVANTYGTIVMVDDHPALDLGAIGSQKDYALTGVTGQMTLFLVMAMEQSEHVFMLGGNNTTDFTRGANGTYTSSSAGNLRNDYTGVFDGGVRVDACNAVVPAGRRLITIAYTPGKASGTFANFGTDCGRGATNSGGKQVCEVVSFDAQLTVDQRHEVEAYLAEKWGINISTVTVQKQVHAGTGSVSTMTSSQSDVVFAAESSLAIDSISQTAVPFTVNGELSFADGVSTLPVTVDVAATHSPGTYPLIAWTSLATGLNLDSFEVKIAGGSEDYRFTPILTATGLSLAIALADDWIYHDLATGPLACESGKKYWVGGTGANAVTVPANANVRLRFDNATINKPASSAVVVGAGAVVTMDNRGTSKFDCNVGKSGVELANAVGTRLHFTGGSGTITMISNGGDVNNYGGCGIYVPEYAEFEMDATNTTITAKGGYKSAGVGSRMTVASGRIIINAGTLNAQCAGECACIGTGCQDNQNGATCTYVKITGGTVTANNDSGYGAAIGTGGPYCANSGKLEYFEMTGGTLTAKGKGGAAIGSGPAHSNYVSGDVGTIKISGGTLNLTGESQDGSTPAAIGAGGNRGKDTSGGSGKVGLIEISGGTVNCTGDALGIGAGWGTKMNVKSATNEGIVRISGGLVNIDLTNPRWGIGGPEAADAANKCIGRIEITGGNLYSNAPMQMQPVNGVANGDLPVYDANVQAAYARGVLANDIVAYYNQQTPLAENGDGFVHFWLPAGNYRADKTVEFDVSTPEKPVTHDMSQYNVRLCKASRGAVLTSGGAETAKDVRVNDKSGTVGFTLSNCVIKTACPFNSDGTSTLRTEVTLKGENALTSTGNGYAALTVPTNAALAIAGDGKLTANGGNRAAAIGTGGANSCGNVTINGGEIVAKGGEQGAGIGTGVSDNGEDRTTGDIVVNGGTITATAGTNFGAGIGGGTAWKGKGGSLKSYTQNGGMVTASGSTGVGGGGGGTQTAADGGWCGPVKITGGTLIADSTAAPQLNVVGAAIGGAGCRHVNGKAGYLVSYEQTGGTVIAKGKCIGIGGGGRDPSNQNFLTQDTTVKITGGTLLATGSIWSVGGHETGSTAVNLKRVEITGGCVKLPNGIQIDPVDASDRRVWPGSFEKKHFADPTNVTLVNRKTQETYSYAGAGIEGDGNLYFYLPNGVFKGDRCSWSVSDGVVRRIMAGLLIVVK